MTQLFGDRVYWANATGCSQAWGGAMPGIPYTKNKAGKGPAWSNSLFENNAEFSLGMFLSVKQQRAAEKMRAERLLGMEIPAELAAALKMWLAAFDDFDESPKAGAALVAELEAAQLSGEAAETARELLAGRDHLSKKTFWMYGGDGWAYDIGFGGLDHVLAMGENVNALIVDTEVYSNTGGQSSKATPIGAVAQFCMQRQTRCEKRPRRDAHDLRQHLRRAGGDGRGHEPARQGAARGRGIRRPLRRHSLHALPLARPQMRHGRSAGRNEARGSTRATGYSTRYDPRKEKPLTIDSKAPTMAYEDFLDGEVRYSALKRTFPENAAKYFAEGTREAAERYRKYKHMEESQEPQHEAAKDRER